MDIELKGMDESARDAHKVIDTTQLDLIKVSEELAALYYQVCSAKGLTPQRVMLDHMNAKQGNICFDFD
jgi:hypothetical protein